MFADDSSPIAPSWPPSQHITKAIIGAFFDVHNELGGGFVENVYIGALEIALRLRHLGVAREVPLKVHYRGQVVGSYRADMIVENSVLLEVKAVRRIDVSHRAQVLNYLKATELELALLCNFGPRVEFERLFWSNARKGHRTAR